MPKSRKKNQPPTISLYEFLQRFPDEAAAVNYFEERRCRGWPMCPCCGSFDVREEKNRKPMPYRRRDCLKHFSVRTGTVMEESRLPLHKRLLAMYLLSVSRKGISSVQTAKMLRVTQHTAWFLNHRIRAAMEASRGLLSGTVEVDETYIGGIVSNMRKHKRPAKRGGVSGKAAVFGLLERGGEVRAMPVPKVTNRIVHRAIFENVTPNTVIYSDDHSA